MSLRVFLILALILGSLLPFPGNKFDIARQSEILFLAGFLPLLLILLSWKKLKISPSLPIYALICFFIWTLLSWLLSDIHNYGWSEIIILGTSLTCFFVARSFDEKEKKFFFYILFIAAAAAALFGMNWYLTHDEPRIAGTFLELDKKANFWPNAFALFLLLVWPLGIELIEKIKSKISKHFIFLGLSILLTSLILTYSRAAWLVLIIQLALLLFLKPNLRKLTNIPVILLIIFNIAVFTNVLQQTRTEHIQKTLSFEEKITFQGTERDTSFRERAQFFKGALQLSLQKPIFGYGPYSFRFVYPTIQPVFLATSDHPHNWFLKIAAEQGLLGLLIFLIAFLSLIYTQRKSIFGKKNTIFFVAVVGALLHNLVDFNLNFITNILLFWLLLGILTASTTQKK